MKINRYELKAHDSLMNFEFVSEGPNGAIHKLVQYTQAYRENVYNIAFGDVDLVSGEIDDERITNNNDSRKVLSTVAATVYVFTDKYPHLLVYATGSSMSRTRLYQIGISNNLDEILQDFEVFGLKEGEWEEFQKNVQYSAFLVRRKQ